MDPRAALEGLKAAGRESIGVLDRAEAWSYLASRPDSLELLRGSLATGSSASGGHIASILPLLSGDSFAALMAKVNHFRERTAGAAAASADDLPLVALLGQVVAQLSLRPDVYVDSPLLESARAPTCVVCGLSMTGVAGNGTPLPVLCAQPYDHTASEPAEGEELFGVLLLRSMVPPLDEVGWVLWREAACGCTILDHCYVKLHGARASFRGREPLCPKCGKAIEPIKRSFWRHGFSGTPHELDGTEPEGVWDEDEVQQELDPRDLDVVERLLPRSTREYLHDLEDACGDDDPPDAAVGALLEGMREREELVVTEFGMAVTGLALNAWGEPARAAARAAHMARVAHAKQAATEEAARAAAAAAAAAPRGGGSRRRPRRWRCWCRRCRMATA